MDSNTFKIKMIRGIPRINGKFAGDWEKYYLNQTELKNAITSLNEAEPEFLKALNPKIEKDVYKAFELLTNAINLMNKERGK